MVSNLQVINSVERAVADLRRGLPVLVQLNEAVATVFSAESADFDSIEELAAKSGFKPYLVLSARRAKVICAGLDINGGIKIPMQNYNAEELEKIVGFYPGADAVSLDKKDISSADEVGILALKLMKFAELMPAIITFDTAAEGDYLAVSDVDINGYEEALARELKAVCSAPLTLKDALSASITAFRPKNGGKEHYAIMVGDIENTPSPLVRVHSSCFTGDLLGSLKCDCGEQLHEAIAFMGKNGGGIILYLMQEGRGIGLVNKLRAYKLQAQDMDTLDANEFLGFDDDERPFLPAAEMLKKLGITKIRLLTNNPRKVRGLEEHGIEVVERVDHIMQSHHEREKYMETKFSRLGHIKNND